MLRYLVRRLLLLAVMLGGLVLLTFVVSNVAPSDPAALAAGPDATRDMIETVRHEYGLDRSLPVQLLRYVTDLLHADLGRSIQTGDQVADDLARYYPATMELVLLSMAFSIVVGVPVGMLSAVWRNSFFDHAMRVLAVSGVALPAFWAALILQLVFGVWLGWLPTSGQGGWQHLIMPAVALGWYFAASLLRLTRSSMLEVLRSEYIKLARLKGLPGYAVIAIHAFKNALIPVLTLAGINLVVMLNAAVIIEVIFAWPGIGRLLYEGIFQRDFPLVQGVVMEAGIMIVVINLIVDILYAYIDPRIRLTK